MLKKNQSMLWLPCNYIFHCLCNFCSIIFAIKVNVWQVWVQCCSRRCPHGGNSELRQFVMYTHLHPYAPSGALRSEDQSCWLSPNPRGSWGDHAFSSRCTSGRLTHSVLKGLLGTHYIHYRLHFLRLWLFFCLLLMFFFYCENTLVESVFLFACSILAHCGKQLKTQLSWVNILIIQIKMLIFESRACTLDG